MISIAPSVLAADFAHLATDVASAEQGGADVLHLDVMDGRFVPNLTIGPPVVEAIRRVTALPLDAHLMIEEPGRYVDDFVRAGANWISVHVEADPHLNRTLSRIRSLGARAGVALNPGTPVGALEEVLGDVDFVLIMTVNPGFGGQRFIRSVLAKIRRMRDHIASNGLAAQIEVDGGIGPGNLSEVLDAGAEIIVAGSAVFGSPAGPAEAVRELKAIAARHSGVLETR